MVEGAGVIVVDVGCGFCGGRSGRSGQVAVVRLQWSGRSVHWDWIYCGGSKEGDRHMVVHWVLGGSHMVI